MLLLIYDLVLAQSSHSSVESEAIYVFCSLKCYIYLERESREKRERREEGKGREKSEKILEKKST